MARLTARVGTVPRTGWLVSESGTVSVLFVVLLPVLLLVAGMAIDLAHVNSERRYVQEQADLAAISAAHALHSAAVSREAARDTVRANAVFRTFEIPDSDIVFGTLADGAFLPAADQSSTRGVEAVRVAVSAPARLFVLDMFFSDEDLVVRREAVARVSLPRVSFALSNCLIEASLFDSLLRPLIGADVDVLCSGRGVDTTLQLADLLEANAALLTPSGEPATYGDVLDADLSSTSLLGQLTGRTLPPAMGPLVRLSDALVLPDSIRRLRVGSPINAVQLRLGDMILLIAELMAQNVASVDASLSLGGVAAVDAAVRVGEPRRMVLNVVPGTDEARASTAQIQVDIDRLSLFGLLDLKLSLRLAYATATLTDRGNACATDPDAVIAEFDPVEARLLDVDVAAGLRGLPTIQLAATTAQTGDSRSFGFTRARFESNPVESFAPEEQDAVSLLHGTLAQLLDGPIGGAVCTVGLLCTGNQSGGASLLPVSLGAGRSRVVPAVPVGNAVSAVETRALAAAQEVLEDLVALNFARAELELLAVTCPSRGVRLVR